jgi:mannose-6-phosphate isomerase-like protein (cupin superfamily)
MEKINLKQKLRLFSDHWTPKIVGELNDNYVKVVKAQGEFVWHQHDDEDEFFLVLDGRLLIRFRDRDVWLEEGECLIIPRGVEHITIAPEEVSVLLFEPKTVVNTGNVQDEKTAELEWI